MFIALLGTCMNHSPFHCFFALLLCVVGCYSHYKCFVEILPPSPSPCRWFGDCPSYCTFPTNKCSPFPFPPCVASVDDSLCYMVRFYPCPLPCLGGEIFLQLKTKEKNVSFKFFCYIYFKFSFFLYSFFSSFFYFFEVYSQGLLLVCLITILFGSKLT